MKHRILYFLILAISAMNMSCGKEFLEKKTSKQLLVPATLTDFQSLLDNTSKMNKTPAMQLLTGDEFAPPDNGWEGLGGAEPRNHFLWADNIYEGAGTGEWNIPFEQVLIANVVLDGLETLSAMDRETDTYRQLKGSALFYRAIAYHALTERFTAPYREAFAATLPGVPVNVSSDINIRPGRGTLKQLYGQMISDLNAAIPLLPVNITYNSRPSKPAAYALLSRLYLLMQDYSQAYDHVMLCLGIYDKLHDFNLATPYSIGGGNAEVIFNTGYLNYTFLNSTLVYVEQDLYNSYETNDWRKTYYFVSRSNGRYTFRPSNFSSNNGRFSGIAMDEVYLIKAECLIRAHRVDEGLDVLNNLLITRYKSGSYQPYAWLEQKDALNLVLAERKKELISRGLRWSDLRRLNLDPDHAVTITHVIKGQTYTLKPNDPKYVFPIPNNEISLSGIAQNER